MFFLVLSLFYSSSMHSADVNVVNLTFYCILLKRNICDAVHKFNYIHLTKSMTQVNVLVVVSPYRPMSSIY